MTPKVIVKGSVPHRLYQVVGYAILLALILWIATSFENFEILNYARVAADAVAILGLMIIIGYSGQVSIGQSFFFGIGAYITAWLGVDKGWPFLLTLPVSAALGLLVGFVIGIPALRIRGLYLALVTLALAAVFPVMAKLPVLEDITGGANGKPADILMWQKPDWVPLDTSDQGWQFLVLCAIATVMFIIASNMMKSRPGRSLVALRDSEVGAAVSGVWPAGWKTGAFALSAAYGAVGGSMLVFITRIAAPETGASPRPSPCSPAPCSVASAPSPARSSAPSRWCSCRTTPPSSWPADPSSSSRPATAAAASCSSTRATGRSWPTRCTGSC